MKDEFYLKLNQRITMSSTASKVLPLLCNVLTFLVYISYFVIIGFLVVFKDIKGLMIMIIPTGASFFAVSVARSVVNKPRPYEKMNITPLKSNPKSGKSFPSRHTFSAFAVAFSTYFIHPACFYVLITVAVMIAVLRVLCGMHYVKDVVVGFLIAAVLFLIEWVIV